MKELSPEQLAAKFPNGWRLEMKRQVLANGEVREYSCRRAIKGGRAGRRFAQSAKKLLLDRCAALSEEQAAALLEQIA